MTENTIPLDEARRRHKFEMPEAHSQPSNPAYIAPRLRIVSPITLEGKTVPDRPWVVPNWIPHGSVTMINGDGGVGKTLLAQQLMTCCATGRKWLGYETMRCKALGIFCEDDSWL